MPYQSPYTLYKYQHKTSPSLNPHPVLFIPGSEGSFDQVRSLASGLSMNKKNTFQYFTLDFRTSRSSAIHGDAIVNQAAFVNEAIHAIFKAYASQQGTL
jgi:hypothetical protein